MCMTNEWGPLVADTEWIGGGRLEIAQIVWCRALELDGDGGMSHALELARLARHDRSVLQHAMSHGQAIQDQGLNEPHVDRAVAELQTAIALVGPPGPKSFALVC